MIEHADGVVGLALSVAALVGVVFSWLKWVRPKYRSGVGQVVAVRDSILGRDAIYDSITGREIEPELPGIGRRMSHQEQQMEVLTDAVAKIAQSTSRLDEIDHRVKVLEDARVERVVAQAESAQAWRAIANAQESDTPTDQ